MLPSILNQSGVQRSVHGTVDSAEEGHEKPREKTPDLERACPSNSACGSRLNAQQL
ncbi:hypothetical protein M406DRAFT_321664 [Cryphonectria parasitica EP155]|uniref:Uncharacterized protein n=1 Tax=Cryphonectria parasitica (strain ATCC 38755 / EP155) TaxID=660469 RepID=A0A9P5CQM8_CRYP1|nr:uncharacterized protein M406DRAFT_321664 [Cryphonectria parasitica EP155]KAF3767689.1 hypothetical protein M406DRAFT_321664 [Cryphonectria parasitica EP155]